MCFCSLGINSECDLLTSHANHCNSIRTFELHTKAITNANSARHFYSSSICVTYAIDGNKKATICKWRDIECERLLFFVIVIYVSCFFLNLCAWSSYNMMNIVLLSLFRFTAFDIRCRTFECTAAENKYYSKLGMKWFRPSNFILLC